MAKMSVLPNTDHRFIATQLNSQQVSLEIPITDSKSLDGEQEGPIIANTIVKEKNKVGGLALPHFKIYYKAIVIKTVIWWEGNRQMHS
jgi:hypothetical protein